MKGIVTASIIIGASLLLVGGAIIAVGAISTHNSKIIDTTVEVNDSFENIDINLTIEDITFKPATDGQVKVVFHERENWPHTAVVSDNTLKIDYEDNMKWYEKIFNWDWRKLSADVYLPANTYGNLKIKNHTGDVSIPSDYTFASVDSSLSTGDFYMAGKVTGDIKGRCSTGSFKYSGETANSIDVKTSTGSIQLKNTTVAGKLKASSDTGSITLQSMKADELDAHSDTGSVKIEQTVVTNHMEISTSTGGVRFFESDAGSIKVKTSTGSVKGSLLTKKIFYARSSTGHISVPKYTEGGLCEISTSTGSIEITVING